MKQKQLVDLWSLFAPMVVKKYGRKLGTGPPPVDLRWTFKAIILIVKTGAPWRSIREDFIRRIRVVTATFNFGFRKGCLRS
ncbi:transposase [Flavisolibacter sp. BT320]|nr:transposase [Flavisolibacter longurius]